jgi:potassium-transporting ATPase KdpC subunit
VKENDMKDMFRPLFVLFALLTLITGVVYPLAVTGVAQVAFPSLANGSVIAGKDGRPVGSELIGQPFSDPKHFWSRPSGTSPQPYNGGSSGASNLGPSNPALADAVKARIEALRAADPGNTAPVPVDLVTASASGLDPHISVAAAKYQAVRVAKARNLPADRVMQLVEANTEQPLLGFLGEPGVNVLRLNLALDGTR